LQVALLQHVLEQFSVVLPRHLGFEINRARTAARRRAGHVVLGFTAGIASLPMNLPLLKSYVLGIN